MGEDQKKVPTWKAGKIEPNKPVKVTLKSAKPVATGQSTYGTWNLWTLEIENQKVFDRETKKELSELYSGEAVCFPSEKLHEQFMEHTNGTQEGVNIEVTLVPKQNDKGWYTTFESKLVEGGTTPPSNLMESHNRFLNDFKTFLERKVVSNEKGDFFGFGKNDTYSLDDTTLEKLWTVHSESYTN